MKNQAILKQEAALLEQMEELADEIDRETAHTEADNLLCEYLRLLGKTKIVEAFERLEKWYA